MQRVCHRLIIAVFYLESACVFGYYNITAEADGVKITVFMSFAHQPGGFTPPGRAKASPIERGWYSD
jgi:hypothetical protein